MEKFPNYKVNPKIALQPVPLDCYKEISFTDLKQHSKKIWLDSFLTGVQIFISHLSCVGIQEQILLEKSNVLKINGPTFVFLFNYVKHLEDQNFPGVWFLVHK